MGTKSKKSASNISINISRNILVLQKTSGKSRKKVCEDLGISYYTWGDWLACRSMPSIETIGQIADYFGVPASTIIEDMEASNAPVTIPIWNSCDVITYKGLDGFFSEGIGQLYMSQSDIGSKKLIAYKVDVGAMSPEIEVGDIAIVQLCDSVPNGNLGLFVTGHSYTMCRRIEKDNFGNTVLYGSNTTPTLIINDTPLLDVIGIITEVRKQTV